MKENAKIFGKFTRVSKDYGKDGPVLVGLCGDIFPHDLSVGNIDYIKVFYNRGAWSCSLLFDWPDGIEPAYPAAKTNIKNGFVLIEKK